MSQVLSHHAVLGSGFDRGRTDKPGPLSRLAAFLGAEWRYRRDRTALGELSDRELADIGVGAGQLDHVVRHGRFRSATTPAVTSRSDRHAERAFAEMPASWTEWR